jgi:hypothetical protein
VSYEIEWQVFLRVKSPNKADRLLDGFAQVIGREITRLQCERYWKDESLVRATVRSVVQAADVASAILETLQLCSGVAHQWVVTPPQFYDEGHWEFTGTAESRSIRMVGVAHVDFRIGKSMPVQTNSPPVPAESEAPLLNPTRS